MSSLGDDRRLAHPADDFQGLGDHLFEAVEIEGLEEVFEGSLPHRLNCGIRAGCLRDKDHRDAGIDLADALVNLQTIHVGQDDMPARQARALMGPGLTLGVTCKGSRDLAMQAGEDGADYVAFGAFYPSTTKEVKNLLDPEILAWWSEMMELPSCAIGGITAENCGPLVRAGTDFLAVVGCIWNFPEGPAAGVRALNAAIQENA